MKNYRILGFATVLTLLATVACTVDKPVQNGKLAQDELVFAADPEPAKGRQDVYNSMARAVKYNVDAASQNLNKKIFNQNPNLKPQDIIRNIMNTSVGDNTPLFDASRVLEYAIIYAMSNLNSNRLFVENNFYIKSSQHLALAAIRSHQDTWFALKKVKEIDRLMLKEKKILNELNSRMERQGSLNKNDLEYKKNLEVALLKLDEIRKALVYRLVEYGQLVKAEPGKIELEGRRFYELEDFDKDYNLTIFEEAAVRNRSEFAIAKELVKNYTYKEIRGKAIREYPQVERLDINGLQIGEELYDKELEERAVKIANNLVEAVMLFQKANGTAKEAARRQAFDELGAAILAQVEINYKMVQLADLDYKKTANEVELLKKNIRRLEKSYRLTVDQKIALLNDRIKLIELEQKLSQINAERAVALRSLYFNAGLSPFSKKILKAPLKDIVQVLKASFNKDLVEMLSAAKVEAKPEPVENVNTWAKKENWLEDLLAQPKPQRVARKNAAVKTKITTEDPFAPYGPEAEKFKMMQLGSYVEKDNARKDWEKLSVQFSELAAFKPALERSHVGDKIYYRLLINAPQGGLREICNKLRGNRVECLLK